MCSARFVHKSAIHKPLYLRSKQVIFTDLVKKSRVVPLYPNTGLTHPDNSHYIQLILHDTATCNLLNISK